MSSKKLLSTFYKPYLFPYFIELENCYQPSINPTFFLTLLNWKKWDFSS